MAVLRRRWRQWRRSWTGLACVGAGLVGGVEKTAELHAMTYKEFMKMTNKPDWAQAVKEVHERMVVMNVWRAVPREDVPKDAKVTTTTFSMKENANGRFRARVNTRDFMLKDGKHYNSDNISSPVTLLFVLCLCCLLFLDGQTNWLMWSVHSCAATFKRKNNLREGSERVSFWHWRKLASKYMKYRQLMADPCLNYSWTMTGLIIGWRASMTVWLQVMNLESRLLKSKWISGLIVMMWVNWRNMWVAK